MCNGSTRWLLLVLSLAPVVAESDFDVNDILDVNFMPGALLLLDGSATSPALVNATRAAARLANTSATLIEGSFGDAMSTMGFHRKMMNEYLCRTFLADQILEEITPVRFNRRVGMKSQLKKRPKTALRRKGRVQASAVKDTMLSDPGSSNYKDWLSKTTTLEDIYRNYGMNNRVDDGYEDGVDEPREDIFDGDVTGFAVQGVPQAPHFGNAAKVGGHSGYGGGGGSAGGGGGGGGYHSGPAYAEPNHVVAPAHYGGSGHAVQYQPHQPQHYDFTPQFVHYHHSGGGGGGHGKKDMILKDLFDIALTALAFLSFGVFAIQVILCIAATTRTTTAAALSLMSLTGVSATAADHTGGGTGTGTGTGTGGGHYGGGGGHYHRRARREAENSDNSAINELARRVLVSMEAVFVAEHDDGNCLRHEICANNRYSRSVEDNQRIWIPVYGLALSWLSGRLSTSLSSAPAMLESLKAAALGLGKADCDAIYPECNITKERDNRRRRRRKRSVN